MTERLQASVPPEILFVERCTQFLVPGGRMGIVLPDNILGAPGLGYIREWLIKNHRIIASVDLHADTFQPRNGIVEHFSKYAEEVTSIGDRRISNAVILPGRFKRVYVDEGYGYVLFGGKQIHTLDPSGDKYLSKSKHDDRVSKELLIDENTTLITRSGTIGKVALVPKHWAHWIASEHIIRVVPASQDIAGYNYIFLLSDYGRMLIQRYTYGAVVDEIDSSHVKDIPIPLLKDHDIQNKINDLALEANKKRYEAYKLEKKALEILDKEVIYAR